MKRVLVFVIGLLFVSSGTGNVKDVSDDESVLDGLERDLKQHTLQEEKAERTLDTDTNGGISENDEEEEEDKDPPLEYRGQILNGMKVEENGRERTPMNHPGNKDPLALLAVIDGDDDEVFPIDERNKNIGKHKRNLLGLKYKWPKGIVPYSIDRTKINITAHLQVIKRAFDVLSNLTCVRFLPVSEGLSKELGHPNYVEFTAKRGCTSYVGMLFPKQTLSLAHGCMSVSIILHEMLHAMGFNHEQDRGDRDNYVRMVGSWIGKTPPRTDNYGPYDLQSIMQYSLEVHGERVMKVLDADQAFLIKSRKPDTLQFYDVLDVTNSYECAAHCTDATPCENGGFLDHRCQCYCPDHTSGTYCEILETDHGCGGIFEVEIGKELKVESPNFPESYNVNASCRWIFKGKEGYHLRMTIDEMHLPYNYMDKCYHWLEIHYNLIGHPGVLRCGEAAGLTFTTSRDSSTLFMIGFNSKIYANRKPEKGFSFRIYLVGDHCLNNPCHYGICKETGSGYKCECESGFAGQHCDEVLAGQKLVCDFDSERPCLFINTPEGDHFDWTLSKYGSSYPDTGPKHARTGHGYLVADMSPPRKKGDLANLVTAFDLPAEDRCLSFYYNMYGEHVETLMAKASSNSGKMNTVWSKSGKQGPKWHFAQISLPAQEKLKILFEAESGLNYSSAIALDDITLSPGLCNLENQDDVFHLKTFKDTGLLSLNEYGMTFDNIGWFNFEVHGCNDAFVIAQTTAEVDDNYYWLALGVSSNMWSYLRKYEGGKQTISLYAHEPVLDCDKYNPFWLGWKDDTLQVGRGFIYGENVLMSSKEKSPLDVKYIKIKSTPTAQWDFIQGNCLSGFFKCPDTGYCLTPKERCDYVSQCKDGSDEQNCIYPTCGEEEFRCTYGACLPSSVACDGKSDCSDGSDERDCPIHVPPYKTLSLKDYGYTPEGKTSFKFTVKACSNAWVTLWGQGQMLYKTGLGRGNKWASLERTEGKSVKFWGPLLDCDVYLPFYVGWSGTSIKVGQGHVVGEKVLMELRDQSVPSVDDLKVGSFAKDVLYNIDAALPPCDESKQFSCGYGRCIPAENRCDHTPHCTDGSDEKDCPILVPAMKTALMSEYKYNISGLDWINFQLKGCANAFIRLTQNGDRKFNVMLGRNHNKWSSLSNEEKTVAKHQAVLDCDNYKSFWFSWSDGLVQFGEGLFKGEKLLFKLEDKSAVNIDDAQLASYKTDNSFIFREGNCFKDLFRCTESDTCISPNLKCNGKSDCAPMDGSDERDCAYGDCDPETEFKCGYGRCFPKEVRCNEVTECSDGSDEDGCPILTKPRKPKSLTEQGYPIRGLTWVNFYVQTCADAQIFLENMGKTVYKILLGRGGNKWSSMEKIGGRLKKFNIGPLLNCTGYLPFWVSWNGGEVSVGKGLNRNENTIMTFTDPDFDNIDDVQLRSFAKPGRWYFEIGNCFPGLFKCSEGQFCIPSQEECNGRMDCVETGASDEKQCSECTAEQFRCHFGRCLAQSKRCDGQADCWDKSDETDCPIKVPVLWASSYLDLGPKGVTGRGRDALFFTADACSSLLIGLMVDKSDASKMYAISLGRGGNTYNTISKDGTQVKYNKVIVLDCTIKHMWITWKDGRIAAGTGSDVTQNVIIDWVDENPMTVNDIGLSSWNKPWTFQIVKTGDNESD